MRLRAVLLLALLAASCQQGEAGRSTSLASQFATWEATEARLDAEARQLAPRLQQLARPPGGEAALEAYESLEAARQTLHKTRVTITDDLSAPQVDPSGAEKLQRTAEERMATAIQKLERRIAASRALTTRAGPPAEADEKVERVEKTGEPPKTEAADDEP